MRQQQIDLMTGAQPMPADRLPVSYRGESQRKLEILAVALAAAATCLSVASLGVMAPTTRSSSIILLERDDPGSPEPVPDPPVVGHELVLLAS